MYRKEWTYNHSQQQKSSYSRSIRYIMRYNIIYRRKSRSFTQFNKKIKSLYFYSHNILADDLSISLLEVGNSGTSKFWDVPLRVYCADALLGIYEINDGILLT